MTGVAEMGSRLQLGCPGVRGDPSGSLLAEYIDFPQRVLGLPRWLLILATCRKGHTGGDLEIIFYSQFQMGKLKPRAHSQSVEESGLHSL